MGQIQLTIALVSIALFTIAIIGFAVNFAVDNNAPINIADDPDIVSLRTNANNNVSAFGSGTEDQYNSILNTTIEPGSDIAQSSAPFAVTPTNAIGTSKNILLVGYERIFGSNSGFAVFITALIAMIVFMLGLFLYKTLKGFPD